MERSPRHTSGAKRAEDVRKHSVLAVVQGVLLLLLTLSVAMYIGAMMRSELCLQVRIGHDVCGYVSSPAVMQEAISRISAQNTSHGSEAADIRPVYSFVNRLRVEEDLLDTDDCYALLVNYTNRNYENAYALSVGGTFVANLATPEEAQSVIDRFEVLLTQEALKNDRALTSVSYSGLCTVSETLCRKSDISEEEQVFLLLSRSVTEEQNEDGAQSGSIPPANDAVTGSDRVSAFSRDSVYFADPLSEFETLRVPAAAGQSEDEIEAMRSQIGLSTKTVREVTETILLPHTTSTVLSDSAYVGTNTVKTVGEDGIAEQVWRIEYLGGEEVTRELLSVRVVSDAIEEVVIVGTKEYPRPVPTGTYIWPLDREWNHISSPFGWRSDPFTGEQRYHKGIDIYAPKGYTVYAVDGGLVTYAGWDSSRGLYIVVDQGNGLEFYYEHLSKMLVTKGDRVYQGQSIAKVGDTGRATGYHLHYEVHKNGEVVNPLKYTKRP